MSVESEEKATLHLWEDASLEAHQLSKEYYYHLPNKRKKATR
jgi:hypothetical protein